MNQAVSTLKKMTGKSEEQIAQAVADFVNGQHASVIANINHPSIIKQIAEMLK